MSTQTKQSNPTSSAKSMAELLSRAKPTMASFSKGDLVKGRITKLTPSEILVDVNAKTEAVVLEKDKKNLRNLLSSLKVGDEVTVSILNAESDTGNPVVSLRRFMENISWEDLKKKQESHEAITGTVSDTTKGGFLIDTSFGVSGFLPNSQTSFMENPQDMFGKKINVFIIELSRPDKKIIFSQRPSLSTEDFKKKVANFKTGQKVEVTIATVTPFGLFVTIKDGKENIDGLIHISEIAWEKTDDSLDAFAVGQTLSAVIIRIDFETKRIDLSLRRLTEDPFEALSKKYTTDQKVKGTVLKMLSTGVLLSLEENVEGFMRKEKIPMGISYEVGQSVEGTVSEIDNKRRRVIITPILKEKPIGYR